MHQESFVASDIHQLKKVIVQRPGNERYRTHVFAPGLDAPGFASDYIGEAAETQHKALVKLLEAGGAETLEVRDLLNSAIEVARIEGLLLPFLTTHFPRLAEFEVSKTGSISADDLIGSTAKTVPSHSPDHQLPAQYPLQWMYYTRDSAMAVPEGIVLANFEDQVRKPETAIFRFMYEFAPQLVHYPVVFDAEKENVLLQGGDFITFDKNTILLGIGNMTSEAAAMRLAQKLNKQVIGVSMPYGPANKDHKLVDITPLHVLFLHLDTIFNLIDSQKALAIPYFLQNEFATHSPFQRLLETLALDQTLNTTDRARLSGLQQVLSNVGEVTTFEPGTGQANPTGQKLVDFLETSFGFSITYAAGRPKQNPLEQIDHLVEAVMPELRFQAANVVATSPGEVIIYKHDTAETQSALKESGVIVKPFDGHELMRWNGGPHCMTSPIERETPN